MESTDTKSDIPAAFIEREKLTPAFYIWRVEGELTEMQPGETGLVDANDISTSIGTIKIKIQGKYPDEIYVRGFERASDNIDDADRPLFRVY